MITFSRYSLDELCAERVVFLGCPKLDVFLKKTGEFFGLEHYELASQKCYADAVPGELWFGDLASKREGKLLKNRSVPLPTQF